MSYPVFTVVTPTLNQGEFIEKTIDSVLSQGYPNLEYIIIDGGSKDNTLEIIKKYENHLAYWDSQPDNGQGHAINKGMAKANGHYLTWINSDDFYLPGALNNFVELFAANPDAGIVVGAGRIVDQSGKEIYFKAPTPKINIESLYTWLNNGNFMQPSSAFTRTAWNSVHSIDEKVHIALDLDLWIRMAKAGVQFVTTEAVLSEALSHPAAKTTAYEDLMQLDCALIITRHGGEHEVRKLLEDMVTRYSWYRRNYEAIASNPILKLLRPIVKRFSKPGEYWNEFVPPWVK